MAEITAAAVKQLRELTDMPMMKCKQALTEAEGDQEKAIEILKREAGQVLEKRAQNVTAEGQVFLTTAEDGSRAAMVEIQCESAPVATGEGLSKFGKELVSVALSDPALDTPDQLLAQTSPSAGKTFKEQYDDMVGTIREKIVVNRVMTAEGPVGGYVHHDGKTGVLFQASGEKLDAPVLRDVAMHIAALRPTVCTVDELDPAEVQAERDRLTEEAKATGKPNNIIEKIVDGRMKVFYVDKGVLELQPFAKDDTKTVSQALAEHGLKAKSFTRWVIGQAEDEA